MGDIRVVMACHGLSQAVSQLSQLSHPGEGGGPPVATVCTWWVLPHRELVTDGDGHGERRLPPGAPCVTVRDKTAERCRLRSVTITLGHPAGTNPSHAAAKSASAPASLA